LGEQAWDILWSVSGPRLPAGVSEQGGSSHNPSLSGWQKNWRPRYGYLNAVDDFENKFLNIKYSKVFTVPHLRKRAQKFGFVFSY
jgi:hypothetical protein